MEFSTAAALAKCEVAPVKRTGPMGPASRKHIGVAEAARQLNISETRLRALCRQGWIDGARLIGAKWQIPRGFKVASPATRGLGSSRTGAST